MGVTQYPFGKTKSGKDVSAYKIESGDISVTLIEYGATVQSILVPDKDGRMVDIVLGYDCVEGYEENTCYFGATIGRVGNRIANAEFSLNGKTYKLVKNTGNNHLHGGIKGFDKCVWKGSVIGDDTVSFNYLSPDGEEGYPANLDTTVTFTVKDNALFIKYDADADDDTIVNLTNHSYFNLNGGGDILDHYVMISAQRFTENSDECVPTGRILDVEATPFDFRTPKKVGENIFDDCTQLHNGNGYDHNFVLTGEKTAAEVYSCDTKIHMTMQTRMPGVQFYTGNSIYEHNGKGGQKYIQRGALCLETQLYPNALNCYGFPSPVLKKGEHLYSETSYHFGIIQ